MSSSLSAWRSVRLMMPYISMSMAFLLAGLFRVMSSTPSPLFSTKTFKIWKLQEVWHEIFVFRFFSWISVHRTPDYSIGGVSIFRKFAEIFANEWLSPVSTTSAKNYRSVIDTGDKHLFAKISANFRSSEARGKQIHFNYAVMLKSVILYT